MAEATQLRLSENVFPHYLCLRMFCKKSIFKLNLTVQNIMCEQGVGDYLMTV